MFRKLIPRQPKFFELFERAAMNVLEGSKRMADLLGNYTDVEAKVKAIKDVEHLGDEILHETMALLNTTFITPIDREDIHTLISKIDDVLDFMDASANRLMLYRIAKPTPEMWNLCQTLTRAIEAMVTGVKALKDVKKVDPIRLQCIEINRLENEGDQILRAAMVKLFDEEKDAIQVIKLKEIYEDMEAAIDRCEDVADTLEGIMLKNA